MAYVAQGISRFVQNRCYEPACQAGTPGMADEGFPKAEHNSPICEQHTGVIVWLCHLFCHMIDFLGRCPGQVLEGVYMLATCYHI